MMKNKHSTHTLPVPEGESLQVLLNKIYDLCPIHMAGYTYYDKSDEWKTCAYGWHNPLFPPEYRRCCLTGNIFRSDPSCDLYYLMAHYYEDATKHRAPCNFELDRSWKSCIASHFSEQDLVVRASVINIISYCTRWQKERRIRNAAQLTATDCAKTLSNLLSFHH